MAMLWRHLENVELKKRGSSAETGIPHLETEDLFGNQKKRIRNPLIPIGALLTVTVGLISFRQGNSQLVERVVQVATVALMVGTAYYYGEKL
ncbi:hypothetical protein AMTRI_Chr03g45030 [Amborella trichopoda]